MALLNTATPCPSRPGNAAASVTFTQVVPSTVDQTSFTIVGVLSTSPPITHSFPP